jgi:hypothetical protein
VVAVVALIQGPLQSVQVVAVAVEQAEPLATVTLVQQILAVAAVEQAEPQVVLEPELAATAAQE